MSRINQRRKNKARNDAQRRKATSGSGWGAKKRHQKNPQLAGRALTGSVHYADYPDDGFTSRIRQRDNRETRKMAEQAMLEKE